MASTTLHPILGNECVCGGLLLPSTEGCHTILLLSEVEHYANRVVNSNQKTLLASVSQVREVKRDAKVEHRVFREAQSLRGKVDPIYDEMQRAACCHIFLAKFVLHEHCLR